MPLAVKLVPLETSRLRFGGEARALASLGEHPHVVARRGWGTEGAWGWLAMERLEGTLLDRLEAGPLPLLDIVGYGLDALCGLGALHHRGILHRDVKPANLFLRDGRAVLGDLGVARLPPGSVPYATTTGTRLGTRDYAAPEQARDAKRVDARADLYSVGATLFALATRRRPAFLFASETMPRVFDGLPPELDAVVRHACRNEPEERYADARAMTAALASVREALGGPPRDDALAWYDRHAAPPSLWRRAVWFLQDTFAT